MSKKDSKKKDAAKKSAKKTPKVRIGVVDTMFARYDMGAAARDEQVLQPFDGVDVEVDALVGISPCRAIDIGRDFNS